MCRRHVSLLLASVALLLVPVAVAWACSPRAHIQLDQASYQPGAALTVSGTNFLANTPVTFSINDGPALATAPSTSTGYVTATFALPAAARTGDVVLATARDTQNGAVFSASGGLIVERPAPVEEPAPATSAPATASPAGQPAATAPGPARGPVTARPVVKPEQAAGVTGTPARRTATGAPAGAPSPATTRSPTRSAASVRAPAGSHPVAPAALATESLLATPAPAARRSVGAARPAAPSAQPSVRSATSDLWSDLGPQPRPTVQDSSAASAAHGSGPGVAGTLLLALSLGGLVAGIAFNDARRRAAAPNQRR